jgi:HD-GYP domain-containing protein (c-di-GMP phosphodiesterase class II)
VGVANTVWSHPGALSTGQWEQVRMHAYYTDRILSRVHGLEDIARLAGSDHERLDGSGYHRGSSDLDAEMRILAAADQFQAMTQTRPHRPALAADAIVDELRSSVRDGTLASRETEAVIGAAVGSAGEVYVERPASLTEREVQVLRLLARGLTNKQVANTLGISPKTVGSHVEHIYAKAGVSTRAAVTLFAIENDLAG